MEQQSKRVCEKRTYTVDEVAALLGISRTSAYEFVKRGEVKFVKSAFQYEYQRSPLMNGWTNKHLTKEKTMASIRKRRGTFSVVYTYENENGEKKQRWETFKTYAEAHKRRAEIEYKQTEGTFLPPNKQTVADVLKDYVALYGEKTWSYSTFNSNCSMIANYIVPIIGNKEMKEITPREADKYIKTLQKTQPVEVGGRRRQTEYMTPANIERVIKLLRSAFKQAVRWEVIARNPFDFVTLPKVEKKSREIWTAETIRKALDSCKDAKLLSP